MFCFQLFIIGMTTKQYFIRIIQLDFSPKLKVSCGHGHSFFAEFSYTFFSPIQRQSHIIFHLCPFFLACKTPFYCSEHLLEVVCIVCNWNLKHNNTMKRKVIKHYMKPWCRRNKKKFECL